MYVTSATLSDILPGALDYSTLELNCDTFMGTLNALDYSRLPREKTLNTPGGYLVKW